MYSYTELTNRFNRLSTNKLTVGIENNTTAIKQYFQVNRDVNSLPDFIIRLHSSDIAVISQDKIVLYAYEWRSHTTKDRLNKILGDNKVRFSIYQVNNMWWIYKWDFKEWGTQEKFKFNDGVTFKLSNNNWNIYNYAQDNTQELKALRNKITKYVNGFYNEFTSGKLTIPSNGDCFYCGMYTIDDNKPLGDAVNDTSHLLSHIEESYYVPSLLINAVKSYSMSILGNNLMYAWINQTDDFNSLVKIVGYQIKKSLLRYMIDKLIKSG